MTGSPVNTATYRPLGEKPYGASAAVGVNKKMTAAAEMCVKKLPKISAFMDTVVPVLSPETHVVEAVDFLLEHQVTGAPVVDSDEKLVGIITETDLLKLITEGIRGEPPTEATVAEYMTSDVITVAPTVDIYYVAGVFVANKFRRLPVVVDDRIVGAITRYDLLRVVRRLLEMP